MRLRETFSLIGLLQDTAESSNDARVAKRLVDGAFQLAQVIPELQHKPLRTVTGILLQHSGQ